MSDLIFVGSKVPKRVVERLKAMNINISKAVREYLTQLASGKLNDNSISIIEIQEIKEMQAQLNEKITKLEIRFEEQIKRKQQQEQETLITLLKEEFSDLDIKTHLQEGTPKPKLQKWCMERIKRLAAKTRATEDELFKLACEHVEGFKEV